MFDKNSIDFLSNRYPFRIFDETDEQNVNPLPISNSVTEGQEVSRAYIFVCEV